MTVGLLVPERVRQSVPAGESPPAAGRNLWWLSPAGSLLLVVPASVLVALRISDLDYRFFYKEPRILTGSDAGLFLLAGGIVVLGALLAAAVLPVRTRTGWPALVGRDRELLVRAEPVAFGLTMFGYLALALIGAARGATPSLVLHAITSQDNYSGTLKTVFAPVAGVSSFTQIGIAYVVVCSLLLCGGRQRRLVRRLVLVLVLGLLRSYLLTERLAILELVVPLVAIGAFHLRQPPRRRPWLPFAPLLAVPVLLLVFGAFEYSRSWVFYRTRTTLSFPQFVVNRLAGYYATSYNNGAAQLHFGSTRGRLPYASLEAFWTAPGVAQAHLYPRLAGQGGGDALKTVLQQHGNPEFNNPGGLAVPLFDFGVVGGLVFFLIVGIMIGLTFQSWRAGSAWGLLIYPVLFTGLLELPRYLYWTQGRVFPPLVFLLVLAAMMSRPSCPVPRRRAGPERT